jgi:alpha-tubulin suppressor-like RCC1 family protein
MKNYFLFLAVMLTACGGSTPGQPEPPDAGDGGGRPDAGPIRACQTAADCDDGADCTTETCGGDGTCVYEADHAACDNDDMCDGVEQCVVDLGCQSGEIPAPARDCRLDVDPRVVLGQYHTCAVDPLGFMYCWGSGFNGQLGYGEFGGTADIGDTTDRLPSLIGPVGTPNGESVPLRYVVSAALGTDHTCALLNSGEVLCWGSHTEGQLGYGDLGEANVDVERPKLAAPLIDRPVNIGGKAVQIGSLGSHTCVLLDNGAVRCWGESSDGALGYPVEEPPGGGMVDPRLIVGDDETPADVGDVDVGGTAVQLSVGSQHTCVVLDDGNARCWGNGDSGRLGYGSVDSVGDQEVPAVAGNIDMGAPVVQIAAGGSHTCALMEGGTVRCWGRGNEGQLGYATVSFNGDALLGNEPGETPAEIGDIDVGGTVVQIAAGGLHTCALLDTGNVRCWGQADRGALGHSNLEDIGDNETPASAGDVNLGAKAVKIAAGGFHTCAVLETGAVRCWGYNQAGQLGYGNENTIGDTEAPASAGDVSLGVSLME